MKRFSHLCVLILLVIPMRIYAQKIDSLTAKLLTQQYNKDFVAEKIAPVYPQGNKGMDRQYFINERFKGWFKHFRVYEIWTPISHMRTSRIYIIKNDEIIQSFGNNVDFFSLLKDEMQVKANIMDLCYLHFILTNYNSGLIFYPVNNLNISLPLLDTINNQWVYFYNHSLGELAKTKRSSLSKKSITIVGYYINGQSGFRSTYTYKFVRKGESITIKKITLGSKLVCNISELDGLQIKSDW